MIGQLELGQSAAGTRSGVFKPQLGRNQVEELRRDVSSPIAPSIKRASSGVFAM